jgi:site-specific DNA recombinase
VPRYAIYRRISKDPKGESASPATQEKGCRQLASERGLDIIEVYTDVDRSAYKLDVVRPQYEAMLKAMAEGLIDGVLVWKLDRLMRRIVEFSRFWSIAQPNNVALVSKNDPVDTTTPLGLAIVYLLFGFAEQESYNTSLRARARHLELAENGQVSGGGRRPFGYEADRITIRLDEATEIEAAVRRVLAGESLRGITHDWRDREVRTVTGAVWSPTTIKRLLCSGRISGQREHIDHDDEDSPTRKITGPAVWPAIITPEDTARLRVILNGHGPGPGNARSYLLSGFVVCGACGTRLTARAAIRKGNRYRRYHCAKDRGGCDRVGISAARLEEFVTDMALERLDSTALAELARADENDADAVALSLVQELESRLEQLARDHYGDQVITRQEFLAARAMIEPRLAEAREAVALRRPVHVLDGVPTGEGELAVAWPAFPLARQRAILGTVLESVTVAPTSRANNRFDPGRVLPPDGEVRWRL